MDVQPMLGNETVQDVIGDDVTERGGDQKLRWMQLFEPFWKLSRLSLNRCIERDLQPTAHRVERS